MSYGKVHDVYWDDDKIESLSDRAAFLGLFLITGRHRNAIGCFKLGIGAITDNPRFGKWGIEGVSEALQELAAMGFIVRDDRTGWTFITNALKHDPIKGAKAAIHAAAMALTIPANSIVYKALMARLRPQLEGEAVALAGKPGYPMRTPIEGVSEGHTIPQPSPSPSPLPSPQPQPQPEDAATASMPGKYAFEGRIIKLTAVDLERWRKSFKNIPNLEAVLEARDVWLATDAPEAARKRWFQSTASHLKNEDERLASLPKPKAPKQNPAVGTPEGLAAEERVYGKPPVYGAGR